MTQTTPLPQPVPTEVAMLIDMSDGHGAHVLHDEAAGGRALVQSSLIPKERHGTDEEWQALGFTFGTDADALFQNATLPEGWTRKLMSDPRGSSILDARGVERVMIFYKAASYDRRANANLVNVGRNIGMHVTYADKTAPVGEIPHLDVLTDAEKADVVDTLRRDLGSVTRFDREDGTLERIKAALATLGHADAEPIESTW